MNERLYEVLVEDPDGQTVTLAYNMPFEVARDLAHTVYANRPQLYVYLWDDAAQDLRYELGTPAPVSKPYRPVSVARSA